LPTQSPFPILWGSDRPLTLPTLRYEAAPNFNGINPLRAYRFGKTAAGFGAVAGVFALFFFAEVPKVRHDIMEKMPIIGSYFTVEVPPEDNPF